MIRTAAADQRVYVSGYSSRGDDGIDTAGLDDTAAHTPEGICTLKERQRKRRGKGMRRAHLASRKTTKRVNVRLECSVSRGGTCRFVFLPIVGCVDTSEIQWS